MPSQFYEGMALFPTKDCLSKKEEKTQKQTPAIISYTNLPIQ
jgi:hypothetical protein